MAYTKENKLRRIIDVQQCFKENWKPGMSITYIYKAFIFPTFKISKRTLNDWLKYPAEKELQILLDGKQQNKPKYKQGTMEFPVG